MSAPVSHGADDRLPQTPTMYAPPWARGVARDAISEATDNALAASEELRRTLPPAPLLGERRSRWREPAPYDGDIANIRLRQRPSLDPVVLSPPSRERGSGLLARVAGAVGLAALAALLMVGTGPLKGVVKAEAETSLPSLWSRFAVFPAVRQSAPPPTEEAPGLAARFAAIEPEAAPAATSVPTRMVQTVPVQVAAAQPAPVQIAPEPAPSLRSLGSDEIAALFRRGEELIAQGDIAAARLVLTRAAEAGDARSALALGATYDASMLGKLRVRGISPDAAQAHAWYAKAAEFGSSEATRRLEQLAQRR